MHIVNRKKTDSYKYISEGRTPRYHYKIDCPFLNADYENFEIPTEIREKGPEMVKEFRAWFKSVEHLYRENKGAFEARLMAKFPVKTKIKIINRENSGITIVDNFDLKELENDIDTLIKASGRFYYKSNMHSTIIRQFGKFSYLGFLKEPLYKNETGYSDEEVKEILKEYENSFKRPLRSMLIEYYRLTLNPDIFLEGKLLDQLGLKPCFNCCEKETESINNQKKEFNRGCKLNCVIK